MNLDAELALSYYKAIARINDTHHILLVQHVETGCFYVQKTLSVYNLEVYRYLKAHPQKGLPQIIEMAEDGEALVVIEEYIAGDTLRSILDKQGPFGEAAVIKLIGQLCDILTMLHAAAPPIVHRDIKPSNLIISSDGVLKLIDFNAAKLAGLPGEHGTQDTVLIGTAGYAAPEQYGFAASGPAADIYAIGVLMNEMLTGRLPRETAAFGSLAPVIQRCLQLDARNRFADVRQLKRALDGSSRRPAVKSNPRDSWLPPGFRSRKFWAILIAVLLYGLVFMACFELQMGGLSGFMLWLYRVVSLMLFLTIIFFAGNYRGVQAHFPLARSAKKPTRIWGVVLWSLVIFLVYIVVLGLIA